LLAPERDLTVDTEADEVEDFLAMSMPIEARER
jgi:hypothetical protein